MNRHTSPMLLAVADEALCVELVAVDDLVVADETFRMVGLRAEALRMVGLVAVEPILTAVGESFRTTGRKHVLDVVVDTDLRWYIFLSYY